MIPSNVVFKSVGHILNRALATLPIWAISSTDDAALVIHAPIPIFSPQSILYTVQRIIDNMRVNKEGEKLDEA